MLEAFYYFASIAIVPSLVYCERLGAANVLAQGVEHVSSILGPALAGAMISLLGLGASFGANTVLLLIATATFAAVLRITNRSPVRVNDIGQPEEDAARTGAVTELLDGVAGDVIPGKRRSELLW